MGSIWTRQQEGYWTETILEKVLLNVSAAKTHNQIILYFDCFYTVKMIEDLSHENNKKKYYGEFVEKKKYIHFVLWDGRSSKCAIGNTFPSYVFGLLSYLF